MIIRATWWNVNPFAPLEALGYSKTVEVSDNFPIPQLVFYARQDAKTGYFLKKMEKFQPNGEWKEIELNEPKEHAEG